MTSALSASPVVLGVDVVELGRVRDLIERYGVAAVRRVCTVEEFEWVGLDPMRLSVVFALKESAIKGMAGRPAGFRWQSVNTRVGAPGSVPDEAARLLDGFARDLGADLSVAVGCSVEGGSAQRLAGLLPGGGPVLGAGRYLPQGEHVFAAVCFWKGANQ